MRRHSSSRRWSQHIRWDRPVIAPDLKGFGAKFRSVTDVLHLQHGLRIASVLARLHGGAEHDGNEVSMTAMHVHWVMRLLDAADARSGSVCLDDHLIDTLVTIREICSCGTTSNAAPSTSTLPNTIGRQEQAGKNRSLWAFTIGDLASHTALAAFCWDALYKRLLRLEALGLVQRYGKVGKQIRWSVTPLGRATIAPLVSSSTQRVLRDWLGAEPSPNTPSPPNGGDSEDARPYLAE